MKVKTIYKLTVLAAAASAVMLTGCSRESQAPAAAAERAVPVTALTIEARQVTVQEEISGRTSAYRVAEVRPQVNGILQKRLFTEGSQVKEGQPLYQIDASTYRATEASAKASLAQAEATLALAKADAARSAELVKINAVSKQSDDSAQANVKTAEAAVQAARASLETARINVGYTSVRAPITGRVSTSEVTPGALMTAYQAQRMTVIHQLDPIYVDVQQTNSQLLKLREDIASGRIKAASDGSAPVTIRLEDGSTYPLSGKLTFQGVSVDESAGTVTLRAVFPNPKGTLMPGMYVRAQLTSGDIPEAILVNQHAVMRDMRGDPYVYVINAEERIEQRPIKVSKAIGAEWLVESGLQAGERVVLEGLDKVRNGALVKAEAPAAASPAASEPASSASAKAE